jgi:dipeptidyl aminopeptidase/acylaminoacyl peptidase
MPGCWFTYGLAVMVLIAPALCRGEALHSPTIVETLSRPQIGSWAGAGQAAVAVSPNGKAVAYLVQETDWADDKYVSHVWLSDTSTGKSVQLTSGRGGASILRWSPDGRWLAFVSEREPRLAAASSPGESSRYEILLIRPDGSETRRATGPIESVTDLRWSPDGRALFYLAPGSPSAGTTERRAQYGDYQVVGRDYAQTELWRADLDKRSPSQDVAPQALVSEPDLNLETFAVSPDSRWIALSASPDPLHPYHPDEHLYLFDTEAGGRPRKIVSLAGQDTSPVFSPDGKSLAFVTTLGNKNADYANQHLALVDLAKVMKTPALQPSEVLDLSGTFEQIAAPIEWKPSGIYFKAYQQASAQIFVVDPAAKAVRALSHGEYFIVQDLAISENGDDLAYTAEGADHVRELYVTGSAAFSPRQLSDGAAQVKDWSLGTVETVSWKSKDGVKIEGVLHKPKDFDPSKKHPLLVMIHGGPSVDLLPSFFPQDFAYPLQSFLAEGAIVLEPNYRGSDGYGGRFRALNVQNLGVGDMWDVMSGVDWLVSEGLADPDRLAVMGWSEGGYISAFLATHTARFKAISVGAGVTDWATYYAKTDIPSFTLQYFKTDPWRGRKIYDRASPMTTIGRTRTPTLIQAGAADQRVPPEQSYELYRGLQDLKVPSRFILYGGMAHWGPKPKTQLAIEQANLDWFNHYIFEKPIPPGSPLLGTAVLSDGQ